MAASITLTNLTNKGTATATVAGATAVTAYVIQIVHAGGDKQMIPVTTNGSGAATATFVPQSAGSVTANLLTTVSTAATSSLQTSHE